LRVKVLGKPSFQEAAEALKKSIAEHMVAIVIGRCTARYQGRSTSSLGEGDRLLIIKEDGSVLLHRPSGYSPVNWQPSTSIIEAIGDSEGLRIKAVRSRPREILEVHFNNVEMLVLIGGMVDDARFVEYMDEHLIRDLLAEEPWLLEKGLRITEKEKAVRNGYIDLYGVDSKGKPVIVELKRVRASREAAIQLKRYVDYFSGELGVRPRGILAAPSISSDALRLLSTLGLEYKKISLRRLYKRAWERRKRGLEAYEGKGTTGAAADNGGKGRKYSEEKRGG